MRLTNLIASNSSLTTLHGPDVEITGIAADSRQVQPGFLFVAIPGVKQDGTIFIPEAIARGAVAVLVEKDAGRVESASILTAPDIRVALSAIAARFYPRQPEIVAAVTGTSGKTSTAQFVREIWQGFGHPSASLGTLGLITATESRYGSLTTPDAITLHKILDETAARGITHLAMEASSHGLAMHRLDHVRLKAAAFTNLSRDHLDFHETMENYRAAKLRLFDAVLPTGATAVLNADSPEFATFQHHAAARQQITLSFGKNGKEIRLLGIDPDAKGQRLRVEVFGKSASVLLPLIGEFQAWNALCALGITLACGAIPDAALPMLEKLSGVPGRLQLAGISKTGGAVFVDYAHKPDALENVLTTMRAHLKSLGGGKLGVVFGCGGNRDTGKRPMMGEIASRLADWTIITDDNPRHEDPATIRRAVLAGCAAGADVREIGDRAAAIETGITRLQAGDALIIAGKGHEPGQSVGDSVLPFDDMDVAKKALGM